MVSKIAPAGAKGTATGIYSTCQVLGVFGGGALGGWLLQEQGANAVFLVNAVLIAIWLIVAWSMQPPSFLASVLIPLKGQDQQGRGARQSREPQCGPGPCPASHGGLLVRPNKEPQHARQHQEEEIFGEQQPAHREQLI